MALDRTRDDAREPLSQAGRAAVMQAYTGTTGNDSFTGTADGDTADLSQGGDDIFRGLSGDDGVYMGAAFTARDRIVGGAGVDFVDLDGDYSAGVTLRAATLDGVEQIGLYGGNSYRLTLNDGNVAALGSLSIFGLGLSATDQVYINGSAETDGDLILYGGAANDTLIGGAGNDLFRTGGGNDAITGGAGIDRITYVNATVGVTIDLTRDGVAQDTGFGTLTMTGIESISGSRFADVITGDEGDNKIFAGGGNDRISGGVGDDWLVIGAGYDGVLPTDAVMTGGAGRDIIDLFANAFDTAGVTFDLSNLAAQDTGQGVFTASGFEDVVGTSFDDVIAGDQKANTIYGHDGGDRLTGGAGNDTLLGDLSLGTDRPSRTNGPPVVFDTPGGADTLIGGGGADTLTGGAFADIFAYLRIGESQTGAADRITDFGRGNDKIDVSAIDADTTQRGNQAFHLGETPGHAGDIVVNYQSGSDQTVLSFYVDADAVADMTIRLDGNHTDLRPADFVF